MSLPLPLVAAPGPRPIDTTVDLPLVARVSFQGRWIDLEDRAGGMWLASDALSQATGGFHSTDDTSPYVPGTFSTGVQPDDVTEVVAVWVTGATTWTVRNRRQLLVAAFSQPQYQMFWRVDDAAELWDCRQAALTRDSRKEYQHDHREMVSFQVPRKPDPRLVLAGGAEL